VRIDAARADVPLPMASSASPEDLAPGAEAQPMAGTSIVIGAGAAFAHRAGSAAASERYVLGGQLVASFGLGGILQLDAAMPAQLGADVIAGGARIDTSLGGLRLGARAALSKREPGESGLGGAFLLRVDTPWGGPDGSTFVYRSGLALDARWRRLYAAAFASIAVWPATPDRARESRLAAGAGASVLVWRRIRLSAAVMVDGEVPLGRDAASGPAPPPAWLRAMGVLQVQRPSGVYLRLSVGTSIVAGDPSVPPSLLGSVFAGVAFGPAALNPWPEPWGATHDTDDARAACRAWAGSLGATCGPLLAQAGGGCSGGPVGWRSRMVWPHTGAPLLGREEIDALVLNLESALWQSSPCFAERHGAALGRLRLHMARLRDYLDDADAHPEDAPALSRSVSVGVNVGYFALGLLVLRSTGGYHQGSIQTTLDHCWDALAEIDADPLWVDNEPERATDLHRTIEGEWEALMAAQARTIAGRSGVQAAGTVSGAMSLASAVGTLPRAWLMRQSGLDRLGAAMARALPGAEEGGGMVASVAGPGGLRVQMAVVPAGARHAVAVVDLTAEEVARLVSLGKLPPIAAVLMRTAGPTPAQIARSRGLSGTNSVSGKPSPGFRSSQRWDTSANARILRENLEKAGVKLRPGDQAHHIVPGTHREAERARQLLDEYGIDINSAENGAVLSKNMHYGNGLHSDAGIQLVTERLIDAARRGGRSGILDELRAIADAIHRGAFRVP
jgi:hypothetical protein